MLTAQTKGGLGNQMFQYAMGLAQTRRLGVGLQLGIDWYKENADCQYSLHLWEGVAQPTVRGIVPNVLERTPLYDQPLVAQIKDGDCFDGYWQTEKYFLGIRQELLGIFRPQRGISLRVSAWLEMISREGPRSALLSVRRGGYVGSVIGALSKEYYLNACAKVVEHVPNPHFFVFSDEPEWCKKNLEIPYRFTVVDDIDLTGPGHIGREDEDLWMMRCCHHAVIANSTFSWWGAWLSPLPDNARIVVAPEQWSATGIHESPDRVPERWIKV